MNASWTRPDTLSKVTRGADSTEEIGLRLAEFLDHVNYLQRKKASRASLMATIRAEPPRTGDAVQDAYLAAVAAYLADRHQLRRPDWAERPGRRLERPWFAVPYPWARAELLRDSPAAFRERNLFTTESALHRA